MTAVPSTHTFSSRNLEAKILADGNAVLIQNKEVLEREIRDLTKAKDDMVRQTGVVPSEFKIIQDEHFKKIEGLENRVVRARIELQEVENALKDIRERVRVLEAGKSTLEGEKKTLERDISVLEDRKKNADSSAMEAERKYSVLITGKSSELTDLTDKCNKFKSANAQVSREMGEKMASIVEQTRILSIRRNDLEIYEARMRKKYPNDQIIL